MSALHGEISCMSFNEPRDGEDADELWDVASNLSAGETWAMQGFSFLTNETTESLKLLYRGNELLLLLLRKVF